MCLGTKLPAGRAAPWAQHIPTGQLYPVHCHGSGRQQCGQSSLLELRTLLSPQGWVPKGRVQWQDSAPVRTSTHCSLLRAAPHLIPMPWYLCHGCRNSVGAGSWCESPLTWRDPLLSRASWSHSAAWGHGHHPITKDRYLGKPEPVQGTLALAGGWEGEGSWQKGDRIWPWLQAWHLKNVGS